MSQSIRLFSVFHLNICFSSINETSRPEVIRKCYWPLLNLIEDSALRSGIEATAYTLEVINKIDSAWITKLRKLIENSKVELIGSGYAQIIGPLVPAEINAANLRIGKVHYESLIGVQPTTALVNEQSYSSGLIASYLNAGYKGIVMEWNNAASAHTEWPRAIRLAPVLAADQHNRTIPLIWNDSVAFQKFQRYAHGEIELDDWLEYIHTQVAGKGEAFCLYGNDVEVFDFRPGRFATEVTIEHSEWKRIRMLVDELHRDSRYRFALPREVLAECTPDPTPRQLETASMPVLVKKQPKYSITRWAVTGRDDLRINTTCWKIFESLKNTKQHDDTMWRELCYLWSSDFRTHITPQRWTVYRERLKRAMPQQNEPKHFELRYESLPSDDSRITRNGHRIRVVLPSIEVDINLRRGLTLERLAFPEVSRDALAGTLAHGSLDDIALSADWYSGNMVLESPGKHKVTDLEQAQDVFIGHTESGAIIIQGNINTRLGLLRKTLVIGSPKGTIEVIYEPRWSKVPRGSLRLGILTLLPSAFRAQELRFRTYNGGPDPETFRLYDTTVDHGAPVSLLVSASHALGMTTGIIDIGDESNFIRIEVDKELAALVGMVTHRLVGETHFCQVQLSAMEHDDTNALIEEEIDLPSQIRVRYSAHKNTEH